MEINGVKIEFLGHSGFLIANGSGKLVAIDPYNVSDNVPKVDYILITHSHYDHCSIKDISKLSKKGTLIISPPDAQSKITKVEDVEMQVMEPGDEITLGKLKIEAIPAYNIDKDFHPKSEDWMGYVLKFESVVIYHAGDSDDIPEMRKLSGYGKHGTEFIVLLPVSGKYVMTAEEAAKVASYLNPNIAIPMHYGSGVVGSADDAKKFSDLCASLGIHAEILEKM